MGFKNSIFNFGSSNKLSGGGGVSSYSSFGRVLDIILDESHPEYANKGGAASINGVFYKPLGAGGSELITRDMSFAYQSSSHIKTVPIVGELIEVTTLPNPAFSESERRTQNYYIRILNLYNSPNSAVYPDMTLNPNIDITLRGKFKELGTVNPISSSPGDVQFEGRQGQSIRFTGGKGNGNPWVDDTNLGSPMIIISNGQQETDNGFKTLGENMDQDDSSIYLVSNHSIPITPANDKRLSYEDKPVEGNEFKGSQVLINGGRLFFNAKSSDIQLSSVTSIGMNTGGTVNIDATEYMCLDGTKIYLGASALSAPEVSKEPVIKGNQLEGFLFNLLNLLEGMANDMARAKTVKNHPIPAINKRGLQAKPVILALKSRINPNGPSTLKSKKVFTE
jgi:hypothetical protein|tara:strand:- start:11705 stop:12883 length:1179 start_codon:yes stop_codon:yes gene_type:complete